MHPYFIFLFIIIFTIISIRWTTRDLAQSHMHNLEPSMFTTNISWDLIAKRSTDIRHQVLIADLQC